MCVDERRFDLNKIDFVDWEADFSVNGRYLGLNVDLKSFVLCSYE